MRLILTTILLVSVWTCYSQNHKEFVSQLTDLTVAKEYASKNRGVSVSLVNLEKDRMLFDQVDTSNLSASIGLHTTSFGRSTKLLKDTLMSMVDIEVIMFDSKKSSFETIEILLRQMTKKLNMEETYWDLKKKYSHTSADFWSGPECVETISKKYSLDVNQANKGDKFEIYDSNKVQMGIMIVKKPVRTVPAFYSISYNEL